MTAENMDKRESSRFEVWLSCKLRRDSSPEVLDGATIDIGRSGALILLTNPAYPGSLPEPGDALIVEVLLPVHRLFGPRCLFCEGVAVRTNRHNYGYLVAVRFEQVEFGKVPLAATPVSSMAVM